MDIGNGYVVCEQCLQELLSLNELYSTFSIDDVCEITIKSPKTLWCYCCDNTIKDKASLIAFLDAETILFIWKIFKTLNSLDQIGMDEDIKMKNYIIEKIKTFYMQVTSNG